MVSRNTRHYRNVPRTTQVQQPSIQYKHKLSKSSKPKRYRYTESVARRLVYTTKPLDELLVMIALIPIPKYPPKKHTLLAAADKLGFKPPTLSPSTSPKPKPSHKQHQAAEIQADSLSTEYPFSLQVCPVCWNDSLNGVICGDCKRNP